MTDTQKMFGLLSQEETAYVPLSVTRGKACANCRWFQPGDPDSCHIVDCYPEPILPTGYCNRHEARPEPEEPELEAIPVMIVEPEIEVEMEMQHKHDEPRMVYIAPDNGNALTRLQRGLRGGLKPGTRILKDNTGKRLMFIVASNGYRDRENEHVAVKSIEEYVDSQWTGDNVAFIGENKHYFWHMKELDAFGNLSDLMFCDTWNGFLVELWREADNGFAKGFYDWLETRPDIEWGASIGAWGLLERNVYTKMRKVETSTLPLQAAANLLTLSEVLPVGKSKRDEYFDDWMKSYANIDGASDLLRSGVDKLAEALTRSGAVVKSVDKPTDNEAVQKMAGVMLEIVGEQNTQAETVDGIRKSYADLQKVLEEQNAILKAQTEELEAIRKQVNMGGRRADRDSSTVVEDEAVLKEAAKRMNEFDPIWGELGVPKKVGK